MPLEAEEWSFTGIHRQRNGNGFLADHVPAASDNNAVPAEYHNPDSRTIRKRVAAGEFERITSRNLIQQHLSGTCLNCQEFLDDSFRQL